MPNFQANLENIEEGSQRFAAEPTKNFVQGSRAPRVLQIQKQRLLELLENYFISKVGRHLNVHEVEITYEKWKQMSDELNLLGPPKSAVEWNTAFTLMKLRVKNKTLRNSNIELSESDQKILDMFGSDWLHEKYGNQEQNQVHQVHDPFNINTLPYLATDEDLKTYLDDPYQIEDLTTNDFDQYQRCQDTRQSSSRRQLSHGYSAEGSSRRQSSRGKSSRGKSSCGKSSRGLASRRRASRASSKLGSSFRGQPRRGTTFGSEPEVLERTLDRLVEWVDQHFIEVVGRFVGPDGVQRKKLLWEEIAAELNAFGDHFKTAEEWHTIFNKEKARTKSKLAEVRQGFRDIQDLNEREKRIKLIFGMDLLDGHQNIGEGGFTYHNTVPGQETSSIAIRPSISATNNADENRILEDSIENDERSEYLFQTHLDEREVVEESRFGCQENEVDNNVAPKRCNLCGSLDGSKQCQLCENKILCVTCDELFHRHPKRLTHVRKRLTSQEKIPESRTITRPMSLTQSTVIRPSNNSTNTASGASRDLDSEYSFNTDILDLDEQFDEEMNDLKDVEDSQKTIEIMDSSDDSNHQEDVEYDRFTNLKVPIKNDTTRSSVYTTRPSGAFNVVQSVSTPLAGPLAFPTYAGPSGFSIYDRQSGLSTFVQSSALATSTVSSISNTSARSSASYAVLSASTSLPSPLTSTTFARALSTTYAQPSTSYTFAQPSTSTTLAQPSTSATFAQPSTSATFAQPSTSATFAQPSTSATFAQPSTSATFAQPSVSATFAQPSTSATFAQQSMSATFAQQSSSTNFPRLLTATTYARPLTSASFRTSLASTTLTQPSTSGTFAQPPTSTSFPRQSASNTFARSSSSTRFAQPSTSTTFTRSSTSSRFAQPSTSTRLAQPSTSTRLSQSSTAAPFARQSTSAAFAQPSASTDLPRLLTATTYARPSTSATFARLPASTNFPRPRQSTSTTFAQPSTLTRLLQPSTSTTFPRRFASNSYTQTSTSAPHAPQCNNNNDHQGQDEPITSFHRNETLTFRESPSSIEFEERVETQFSSGNSRRGSSRLPNFNRFRSIGPRRPRYRHRLTSYEMVEQSMLSQDHLLHQNDRNHAEMINLYTSTLHSFSDAIRDCFGRNNNN